MRKFAKLFCAMESAASASEKEEAVRAYFAASNEADKKWAMQLLGGGKIGVRISSKLLREWAAEASARPLWLVEECYRVVGDLSETIALLVEGEGGEAPSLHSLFKEVIEPLASMTATRQRDVGVDMWRRLNCEQRLVFNKLISGQLRMTAKGGETTQPCALTLECVLIAAQKGARDRTGLLSEYTFAMWDETAGQWVPIAKVSVGLSDEDAAHVDRWARRNTKERFGPVHMVVPLRVFEIGFEAVEQSKRHKSGVVFRNPRVLRMLKDKRADDVAKLSALRALAAKGESHLWA